MSAIATNDVELIDATCLERLNHFLAIKAATTGSKDCAADVLDTSNVLGGKLLPIVILLIKAAVAPANAPYLLNTVFVAQAVNNGLDDYVEAWAKTATGYDGCLGLLLREYDLFPGTRPLELEAGLQLNNILEILLLDDKAPLI